MLHMCCFALETCGEQTLAQSQLYKLLPAVYTVTTNSLPCLMCRLEVLEQMPPFQGGGEMIQDVYLDHSTFAEPPSRFEAGTPGIAEAIGLGVACEYLSDIGMDKVHHYEEELGGYLHQQVWLLSLLLCMLALFSHVCSTLQ